MSSCASLQFQCPAGPNGGFAVDPDEDRIYKSEVAGSFCKASLTSGAMNVIKVMTQTIEDMTEVNNHTFRGTKLVPSPDQISTPQPTGHHL